MMGGQQQMGGADACIATAARHLADGSKRQALEMLEQGLRHATKPEERGALYKACGVVLRAFGRFAEAESAFGAALALAPADAEAATCLGMLRLLHGDFADGWRLYRNRWRLSHWPTKMRYPEAHLWDGEVQPGMRLLLWCEQGFGDAIQFARYIPWLHGQGIDLVVEAHSPLSRLFVENWPTVEHLRPGRNECTVHLPLMDIPGVWRGPLTTLAESVPYLRVRAEALETRSRGGAARIGLAWFGRPEHPDDKERSLSTAEASSLAAYGTGLQWVSLQQDGAAPTVGVERALGRDGDFLDTARVIAGLDLVISVDTAVAHLAAAMGKPVWMLLPPVPDWRWGLHGELTPWYPNMRLFRRKERQDWSAVIGAVHIALKRLVAGDRTVLQTTSSFAWLNSGPNMIGQTNE